MPRFLALIYGDEQRWAAASSDWHADNARRHRDFLNAAGTAVLAGGELVPSTGAVSIRGDEGDQQTVTSGPFSDTPVAIGGFYLLEADELNAGLYVARRIPEASAPASGVEVRGIPS